VSVLSPAAATAEISLRLGAGMEDLRAKGYLNGKRLAGLAVETVAKYAREQDREGWKADARRFGVEVAERAWAYREGFLLGWWENT